ncbi:Nucleotide-binding oligomerization domain-containing protein 1 [Merluccius polli]|uniref:Nucleotide-binding oligomerization domain-containing protein 1 n=1 Tax=Merluccius polli TaxID=89951 RepID=A0AA47M1D5_MERPO|nr:Nucleotide-binding oligomerization domain-containing protein 1 [Merluccius polli]
MAAHGGAGEPLAPPLFGHVAPSLIINWHRELLVSQTKGVQCLLDNLLQGGFFCVEDVEIVQRTPTKSDQMRKVLELVLCKGEEASEYFLYVLYYLRDAYMDLQPWLEEIQYLPSTSVVEINVVNTDPISKYCEKLRHELGQDTRFIMSYAQREETQLDQLYTHTQMEVQNDLNESLGFLESLDQVLDDFGVFNPQADVIYITGDAGMGKSLLLQKLQNLWSKGELQTNAIFFFTFRCRMFTAFRETAEISLRDLLFKHSCYPDDDLDDEVFNYIVRFPERIIFTFDGYDEIKGDVDLMNVTEVVSTEDKAHPLLLLINLLCGKLLRGSRKVLTARTGTEVQNRVVRKKVLLRGFSPVHLQAYAALHFKKPEHRHLVSVHLDASPHLCGLCSTPLFCWIVFKSFKHLHAVHNNFTLSEKCFTITDVFLLFSEVFLSRWALPAKNPLKKSARCTSETFKTGLRPLGAHAKLALRGMERECFLFNQEDVSACDLTEEDLLMGFLRPVQHYDACGSEATFEFLHVTLQSFLAAFALILNCVDVRSILKFFAECKRKRESSSFPWAMCVAKSSKQRGQDAFKSNEHLQYTNLFLCGLLAKDHESLMDHLVPPDLLKKKRALLKAYLSTSIRSHLRGLPTYNSNEGKRVHVLPNFIWMLRCIFETGSNDVARLTAKGITANFIKLGYCNVYSGDCTALNFVLQHRQKLLGVDMDNNNINDYGVEQLRPSFSKMTVVRLCVNQISDSSVKVLAEELCKQKIVKVLGLYSNLITDAGAKFVAQIVEECPRLQILKLGKNKFTSVGGTCLANAIKKSKSVFDVGMWGNTVGDEGAKVFADALRNHPSLNSLSLSANGITSAGAKILAEALLENTVLRIFWYDPEIKFKHGQNTVVTGPRNKQLVENKLTDDVAPHLAKLVEANTGLSDLWLVSNQLTAMGLRPLYEALAHNTALKDIW